MVKLRARIEFRAPKKHKQMIKDIAKNRGVSDAEVLREALAEYLSTYSTIPSMKEMSRQVEEVETRLGKIERTLLKQGIME